MNLLSHYHAHPAKRPARFAAILAAAFGAAVLAGCPDDRGGSGGDGGDGGDGGEDSSSRVFERLSQGSIDKVDLLLAVDNSRSMADKQAILAAAIPDLVAGLVNPRCLDPNGLPAPQPVDPLDKCPPGTKRAFEPVLDLHIGVISSSLGGHGADACPSQDNGACPNAVNLTNNDKGHLLSRLDACAGGSAPTYQDKGFLAWDPKQMLAPPGETDLQNLTQGLRDMVTGAGQIGCGFEAQLESWYRFLVDPEPYESISIINNAATPQGLDNTLLAQRADFLRPGSLVAIVMLSDENDCSMKEFGEFYLAAQLRNGNGTSFRLPRARAVCAADPNDPCCASCGQSPPNCPADPSCVDGSGMVKTLFDIEDAPNLRCFDQKRRFGIDFLYPLDRYAQALSSPTIPNRKGELVPNPIFADLNPSDNVSGSRDPGMIFVASIVGVPWQDVARDPNDLTKGFKDDQELLAKGANGQTTWDVIAGDPEKLAPPKDPHMIESIDPRSGANPITGDPIAQPGSPDGANPINGHEYTPSTFRDDLQYACVFDLPTPRDCSDPTTLSCDCSNPQNDSPLCEENPFSPGGRTLQVRAKAYPGLRELSLMKALGPQGITASICPAQLNDEAAPDFGYRPAVESIIDRLKGGLNQCLSRTLKADAEGKVDCSILEARTVESGSAAACNECKDAGRQPASPIAIAAAKKDPLAATAGWNCFCEIAQAEGDDLTACQSDVNSPPVNPSTNQPVNGWCYVDASLTPSVGNPDIVASCPSNEKRLIRFVGEGDVPAGATVFLSCSGD